ncbi:MAG: SAVED domain-containing protein [Sandaracinaceae bacterium]|nr:MAG: SAVED domain-containing protein [Sandaracinaceae bacterium]
MKAHATASAGPVAPKKPSRWIPPRIEKLLWARAAGRCQCAGCNAPLWKSELNQESVAVGQNAHIWAFSEDGPRSNDGIRADEIHHPSNLILVCYPCHRLIDADKRGEEFSVDILRLWKLEHEARVERVTGIASALKSHVLFYGANTGAHSVRWSFREVANALFPDRYPAEDRAIELGLDNSATRDDGPRFWELELTNLRSHFDHQVRARAGRRGPEGIQHVSVFALAPQPLLVALGGLLGDIGPGDVYQLRREPPGWDFATDDDSGWPELAFEETSDPEGTPALVVGLSASVTRDRIDSVLGSDCAVWRLTVPHPHNDVVVRRSQLRAFRQTVRRALDRVKEVHGQKTQLHIFPAMPVSAAVELGRVRMPKAEMPWRIYDQLPKHGFVPVIDMLGDETVAVRGES